MAGAVYNYSLNPKYEAYKNMFVETYDKQQEIYADWANAGHPIMDVEIDYYAGDSRTPTSKSEFTLTKKDLMDFYPEQKKWAWPDIDTDYIWEELVSAENFLDNLAYAKDLEHGEEEREL